ncbi:MAG: hypothetical protein WC047_04960 [Kiritimatiellales bacterium]
MKKLWLMIAVVLALAAGTQTVSAEDTPMTPVMISLMTPVQAPSPEWDVKGLRIDLLYGRCQNLYGMDLGLVNHTVGKEIGLAAGLVNLTQDKFVGLQVGAVNIAERASALQLGVYNEADDMSGVQIGLINHTRLMRGVQVGLINVIENNDLSFLPIVNFFF